MRNVPTKPPTKLVPSLPKSGVLANKDSKAATLSKSPSKAGVGKPADPTANLAAPQKVVSRDNSKTNLDSKKDSVPLSTKKDLTQKQSQ